MVHLQDVRDELPGWEVYESRKGLTAVQPGTGLAACGPSAEEVVQTARALVRLQEACRIVFGDAEAAGIALSVERWSETREGLSRLAGAMKGSKRVEARPEPPAPAPAPTAVDARPVSKSERYEIAKVRGFTGQPCGNCGSLNTIQVGVCLKCADCNHSGGCG